MYIKKNNKKNKLFQLQYFFKGDDLETAMRGFQHDVAHIYIHLKKKFFYKSYCASLSQLKRTSNNVIMFNKVNGCA